MAKGLVRFDGWRSWLTKLGTSFDKLSSIFFVRPPILTYDECAALFNYNALAAKICSVMPEDGMREGFEVRDSDGAEVEALKTRMRDLQVQELVTEGACYGNAFGGAGIFIGANDGQELDQPLDPTRVIEVSFLRVVDRRDLAITTWYGDPLSTKFNMPETFEFVQPSNGSSVRNPPIAGVHVHETRFVWFYGARTPQRDRRNENMGWPFSKLQRVHDQLLRVGVSWDAAAQLLQILSQTVVKVKGLQEALVSDGGATALEKRAEFIDKARSITRSWWIDADGEEVDQLNIPVSGVGDLLDRQGALLAAAAEIPVTKLFGTQPTGLGATGESDERSWNNRVESYRRDVLGPAIDKIAACLAAEQNITEELTIVFPSLDRPTKAETADIRLKIAQADNLYVQMQAVLPEEIATSRFGGPEYSMDTHLQDGPRDALEFPAPPGAQPNSEDDPGDQTSPEDTKGGSEGTNPKARSDAFDPDEARDEGGRWTASGSLASARAKFAQAREAHKANPTPETRAARAAALKAIKPRRELAAKISKFSDAPFAGALRPVMTAERRTQYLAPRREALKSALRAHAEAPTAETSAAVDKAQRALHEARHAAGNREVAPQAVHEYFRQAEADYANPTSPVSPHRNAFDPKDSAEAALVRLHAQYSTKETHAAALAGLHAEKTSSSAFEKDYRDTYAEERAAGTKPRGAHAVARAGLVDRLNTATGAFEGGLEDRSHKPFSRAEIHETVKPAHEAAKARMQAVVAKLKHELTT